jgi:hypothetical protein
MEKFLLFLYIIFIIPLIIIILRKNGEKRYYNFHNEIYNEKPSNPKIALHTIFVLKQNIPFLEEWIEYHEYIGVDKIYLYDNSKSIGNSGSSKGINKYGLNYNDLISLTDDEISRELNRILQKYPQVIYLKWEPRNEKGEIIYAQTLNINKYNEKYGRDTDWTIYTDIDEFLVSKEYTISGVPIKGFLKDLLNKYKNYNKLMITQKKFGDRFCNIPKNFYEIISTIKNIDTKKWAPKSIIYNNAFVYLPTDKFSIHEIPIDNEKLGTIYLDQDVLCFHHYNVNKKLREWMKDFYKQDTFDVGIDNSIENYGKIISTKINENFFHDISGKILNDFC